MTSGENGDLSRLADQTFCFVPARRRITENLQRFRRQRFKKFGFVGVMDDAGRENDGGGQFVGGGGCAAYFFGETATGVKSIGPTALRVNGKTVFNSAAFCL